MAVRQAGFKLDHDLKRLYQLKAQTEGWLSQIGLQLNPSKTHIAYTLNEHEGQAGFDFLGFNIRQYQVGRYKTRTNRGQAGFRVVIKPAKKAIKRHLAIGPGVGPIG